MADKKIIYFNLINVFTSYSCKKSFADFYTSS